MTPWLAVGALAVGIVGGMAYQGRQDRLQRAIDQQTIQQHERTIQALRQQSQRIDSLYQTDTLTLTKWKTKWDSVLVHDTTHDTITVERIIQVADSTIRSCSRALRTCEDQVAVLRTWLAQDSVSYRALRRENARLKLTRHLGCAVGPSVSLHGAQWVGLTCGVNFGF